MRLVVLLREVTKMTVNNYKDKYCAKGCSECPLDCDCDGHDCDLAIEKYIFEKHGIKYDFRTEEELANYEYYVEGRED